jgi:uncharacterized membrane protein (DUF485 family)
MKYILTILLFLLFPFATFAQDAPVTTTSSPTFEYFNVKVTPDSQSPWNKNVSVYVEFVATINSDKVQIDWDVPSGIVLTPKYPNFFSVKAGETYRFKAIITPKTSGTYNIAANVISWQYNTNYTSSGNALITFGEDLLTVPLTPNYSTTLIIQWVVIIGSVVLAGYVGVLYALKSKRKFDKWFNLPD